MVLAESILNKIFSSRNFEKLHVKAIVCMSMPHFKLNYLDLSLVKIHFDVFQNYRLKHIYRSHITLMINKTEINFISFIVDHRNST